MSTRRCLLPTLSFLFLISLVNGCGPSKSNPVELSGTVTYNGQPVTGGTMIFFAKDGGTYPASIHADGSYIATDFPTGELIVTVDTESLNPAKKQETYTGKTKMGGGPKGKEGKMSPVPEGASQGNAGTYVKIPKVYNDKDKSPLKVTVEAGKQKLNIELKD